jgi:hypothetical protein
MTVYEAALHDKLHVKLDRSLGFHKAKYRPSANTFFFGDVDFGDTNLARD